MSRLVRLTAFLAGAAAVGLVALVLWLGRPPVLQPWNVRQFLDQAPGAGTQVEIVGPVVMEGVTALACSALAESMPPQCGEPSVRVLQMPRTGMLSAGNTSWLESAVLRVQVVSAEEVRFLRMGEAGPSLEPAP